MSYEQRFDGNKPFLEKQFFEVLHCTVIILCLGKLNYSVSTLHVVNCAASKNQTDPK